MPYKNRLVFLISLIAVLALIYTGSLIFTPERGNARSASHVWLDSKQSASASRIVINNGLETVELAKKTGSWFVLHNGREYPARRLRIEDFTAILTARASWPVRSANVSSHARLGLNAEDALRVTIYAENNVLLDLLFGNDDISGREVYVRAYAQNEVRSGDNRIMTYITSPVNSWYNLALFPQAADGQAGINSVQRLSVYNGGASQIFSRRNTGWETAGLQIANPDNSKIENYIRTILNTEGDDFIDPALAAALSFNDSRIVLEFGDGSVNTVRFSESDETGRRLAQISGTEYIYSIPPWAALRLFTDASSFERD